MPVTGDKPTERLGGDHVQGCQFRHDEFGCNSTVEGEQRWHAGGRIERAHHTDGAVDEARSLAAVQSDRLGTIRREYVHVIAAMQDAAKESSRPPLAAPQPKTLLGSLQEASEHEDKTKIYEALTPKLRDLIRKKLDFRPYLKSKIAVLKESALEHGWENTDDVDIDAVNKKLGAGIASGAIRSTQERESVELQGGSPFRSN